MRGTAPTSSALRSAQLLWLKAGDVMLMPSSVVHLVITLKTKLVVAGDILTAANFERAVWADDVTAARRRRKVPSEMGRRLDERAEWLLTRLGAVEVPLALRGRAVERMLGLLAADSEAFAEGRRPNAGLGKVHREARAPGRDPRRVAAAAARAAARVGRRVALRLNERRGGAALLGGRERARGDGRRRVALPAAAAAAVRRQAGGARLVFRF